MTKARKTYDICGDCYSEVIPDQYFPEATRFGTCLRCYQDAFVTRTPKSVIEVGSEVMVVNEWGEPEWGIVTDLTSPGDVSVRFPSDGRVMRTVCEDIGIGVDDTLIATFANGETV